MDASGSMATKIERARETARTLVAGLKPGVDEVAYYTFDTRLQQVRPFSKKFSIEDAPLNGTKAYGATSLWDAIADTAQHMSDRQQRRALVVITDGVDSASRMKPSDCLRDRERAGRAGLYPGDHVYARRRSARASGHPWTAGGSGGVDRRRFADDSRRRRLRRSRPVRFSPNFIINMSLHSSLAAAPGWHPLVVRARKPGLFVRARSGYTVK